LARPHYLVVPRRGAPVFFVHEGQDVVVTPESPEVVSLAPWPLRTIGP